MATLRLLSRAWFGDRELEFPVPDNWDISLVPPVDAEALSEQSLSEALGSSHGAPPLGAAARNRDNALIVVDDLGRPTPSHRIIPHILQILIQAGVAPSRISFLIATGSHRPLSKAEMERKLGKDIVAQFAVANHDAFAADLQEMGSLPSGMPVVVNRRLVEADLVVGIGSVMPHSTTGFSGGGKLLLPGASGLLSIAHLHSFERKRPRGRMRRSTSKLDIRDTIDAFAKRAGLEFSVNVVVNSRREIAGLFCGCPVEAHRRAASFAHDIYRTEIPQSLNHETDILLLNAYPLDADPNQASKSLWPKSLFPRAQTILLDPACDGIACHRWSELQKTSVSNLLWGAIGLLSSHEKCPSILDRALASPLLRAAGDRHFREFTEQNGAVSAEMAFVGQRSSRKTLAGRIMANRSPLWICSESYPESKRAEQFPKSVLFQGWDDLCRSGFRSAGPRRVTVFPCAPLQLPA